MYSYTWGAIHKDLRIFVIAKHDHKYEISIGILYFMTILAHKNVHKSVWNIPLIVT